MIVLIEGNEGTGKTTLIDNLFNEIKFVRAKYIKGMNVMDLFKFMANDENLYIIDRSFISDMVYRAIDGHKSVNTLFDICYFMDIYAPYTKVIFCNNDNAFENAIRRGEKNITTRAAHKDVENGFKFVRSLINNFTRVETFDYDYDYDSIDDVIKFIKEGWNDTVSI